MRSLTVAKVSKSVMGAAPFARRKDHRLVSPALYYKLRAVARSGEWITDHGIAAIAGVDRSTEPLDATLDPVLEAIDRTEDAARRPLLSAVVVVHETGMPRASFFTSVRARGLHVGNDDRTLWQRELRRVHDYWYRH